MLHMYMQAWVNNMEESVSHIFTILMFWVQGFEEGSTRGGGGAVNIGYKCCNRQCRWKFWRHNIKLRDWSYLWEGDGFAS